MRKWTKSNLLAVVFAIAGLHLQCLCRSALAEPVDSWTGNSTSSSNWSDSDNWDSGVPGSSNYGTLKFSGSSRTTNFNDLSLSEHELLFASSNAYSLSGNGISFYDYGGFQSKIENNSGNGSATGIATIALAVNFAAMTGTNRAEINAVTGDITFSTGGTVAMSGSDVAGLQLYGTGHTVTFNDVISETSGSGKYVEVNGGNTTIFAASNTYTGNTYLCNGSNIIYTASQSNPSNNFVRLGQDNGSNLMSFSGGATVTLGSTASSGGVTVATGLYSVGSYGGTMQLQSANSSGTNTWLGNVNLNYGLTVAPLNSGGTFSFTGTTFDLQGNTLTTTGNGTASFSGKLQNSTGSGSVTVAMGSSGKTAFSGTNTYTGGTTITSGTLQANNATSSLGTNTTTINGGVLAGTGSTGGAVSVNSGGTITAGSGSGSSDSVSTLHTGAQTWNGGGTFVAKISTSDGSTVSGNDQLIMSGLTVSASSGSQFKITISPGQSSHTGTPTYSAPIVLADDTTISNNPFSPSNAAAALGSLLLSTPGLAAPSGYTLKLDTAPDGGSGYDLILDDAPIGAPEPTSMLLLGAVVSPLLLNRRRRGTAVDFI
jgi:autotransporter-associated beta strand protein